LSRQFFSYGAEFTLSSSPNGTVRSAAIVHVVAGSILSCTLIETTFAL
jgi:hypothetical protein